MSESLCDDLLFCTCPKKSDADELFMFLDCYLTECGLKWENCVRICTDGAQTMAEKEGVAGTSQESLTKCAMDTLHTH